MDVGERLVGPHWQATEVLLYREIAVMPQAAHRERPMAHPQLPGEAEKATVRDRCRQVSTLTLFVLGKDSQVLSQM